MGSKLKYLILIATTAAAVGVAYTVSAFMNIPETFDWEDKDE